MAAPSVPRGVAEVALQLVQQLYRNPDIVPPYNDALMKQCTTLISSLYMENVDDLTAIRSGSCDDEMQRTETVRARQSCIDFMKRCCCTYVNERLDRIRALRWMHGGALPQAVKANLSEAEVEWLNDYSANLADFQGSFGENGVNLMQNLNPPKCLYTQVRAVVDYGEFETSDGAVIMLKKDSLHALPREDCEMLIKQGVLENAQKY